MYSKLKILILVVAIGLVMVGCGGGGSSSGGVAPSQPLYSTIQDLEFKTLNIAEVWNHNGARTYTTMKFTNNYTYTTEQKPVLIDDSSSRYYAKECNVAPTGTGYTYLCEGVLYNGVIAGWGINIDNGGIITGNFHLSPIGDSYAIAAALANPSIAYAHLEGGVSNTVTTNRDASGIVIASPNGAEITSEAVMPDVDDDINREKAYSDIIRLVPQIQDKEEVSPKTTQAIDKLYNTLLQIESNFI